MLANQNQLGKYEILGELGHGMWPVYLAQDTLLGKQVALKVITCPEEDRAQLREEARILDRLQALNHPNIVRFHGADFLATESDTVKLLIATEWVDGRDLRRFLRETGPLSIPAAADIALKILAALQAAHSLHVIHRDVKPANVLIGSDGAVKLTDFGQARTVSTHSFAESRDGTYAYMAPEYFSPEVRTDHRADLWAVGVTFYEMVTGQRPFQVSRGDANDPFVWAEVVKTQTPLPVATYAGDVPEGLETVIRKALTKDPAGRYQTAQAFIEAITPLLQPSGIVDTPPVRTTQNVPMPAVERRRTSPFNLAAVAAALRPARDSVLRLSIVHGQRVGVGIWYAIRHLPEADWRAYQGRIRLMARRSFRFLQDHKRAQTALRALRAVVSQHLLRLTPKQRLAVAIGIPALLFCALAFRGVSRNKAAAPPRSGHSASMMPIGEARNGSGINLRQGENAQNVRLARSPFPAQPPNVSASGRSLAEQGITALRAHQEQEAARLLQQAVAHGDETAQTRYALGAAYCRLGDDDMDMGQTASAMTNYRNALIQAKSLRVLAHLHPAQAEYRSAAHALYNSLVSRADAIRHHGHGRRHGRHHRRR